MTRLAALLATACMLSACYGQTLDQYAASRPQATVRAAAVTNPGVFELPDPSSFTRVVAVSDVHGMADGLVPLLKAGKLLGADGHWAGGKTLLLVLGDSIDKGPKSLEVLDLWMQLAQEAPAAGGQVVHLLGNHEAEFLASPDNDDKSDALYAELQARGLPVSALTDPAQPRGAFLRHMPLAARVGHWLFCHAGLYPDMPWPAFSAKASSLLSQGAYGDAFITGDDSVLEAKNWWKDAAVRSQYERRLTAMSVFGVVQGHQPKAYGFEDRIGAIDGGRLIKIDNGMAPEAGANPGHLLIFSNPAQLTHDAYPEVAALGQDGVSTRVVPQN